MQFHPPPAVPLTNPPPHARTHAHNFSPLVCILSDLMTPKESANRSSKCMGGGSQKSGSVSTRTEFKTRACACTPACIIKRARFAGCVLHPAPNSPGGSGAGCVWSRHARWIEPHLFALVSQSASVYWELWLSACVCHSLEVTYRRRSEPRLEQMVRGPPTHAARVTEIEPLVIQY